MNSQINPSCKDCKLYANAKTPCLNGRLHKGVRLLIYSDAPDYFADNAARSYSMDAGKILDWMLKRMSISPELVGYDYTLRCYPAKSLPTTKAGRAECVGECNHYRFANIAKLRPKAIVSLGQVSLEAFTGKSKVGDYEGQRVRSWEPIVSELVDGVWVGYGLTYILMFPSDSYRTFRVIYKAAEEAGLRPKIDSTVSPFRWSNVF